MRPLGFVCVYVCLEERLELAHARCIVIALVIVLMLIFCIITTTIIYCCCWRYNFNDVNVGLLIYEYTAAV